jgi:hypothetical protein
VVVVSVDGVDVARLGKGQRVRVPIETDCVVEFRAGFRRDAVRVEAGVEAAVQLEWNRLTGALVARPVSAVGSV